LLERLQKERAERQAEYEREKLAKEEKHKKALEDIKSKGKQLLINERQANKSPRAVWQPAPSAAPAKPQVTPLKRHDSKPALNVAPSPSNNQQQPFNVFKDIKPSGKPQKPSASPLPEVNHRISSPSASAGQESYHQNENVNVAEERKS